MLYSALTVLTMQVSQQTYGAGCMSIIKPERVQSIPERAAP